MKLNLWEHQCQGDFQPWLEVHTLPGNTIRGAVIVIPGGGYDGRALHEARPIAKRFNQLGFHAFELHYRTAPNRFPAPQEDALRAIKLVRLHAAEWHIDPTKIAVCGFSAGGHLAISTGIFFDRVDAGPEPVSARPDALIASYPVICGHAGSFINLTGSNDPAEHEKFFLNRLVRPDMPPVFMWHTVEDRLVPPGNSLALAEALTKQGLPFELHIFPHGPHGLGLGTRQGEAVAVHALSCYAPGVEPSCGGHYPEVRVWPRLCATWLRSL